MAGDRRIKLTKAVQRLTESSDLSDALLRTINAVTPMLTSPVYVGISNNLRDRLATHRRTFDEYAAQTSTPEDRRELLRRDDSFAARAVGSGLTANMLEVYCYPVRAADPLDQRAMIEAVEYFLNRWHQPPFGRR